MADTPEPTISVEDLLLAQAVEQMNKPARVKSSVLLVALTEFVNSKQTTHKHFEQKYPTVTANRLIALIKGNKALAGRVWAVKNDEFGVCLVNVTKNPA